MINKLLGLFNLELTKITKEIDLPDIRFTTDEGTITESIIEYGENEDGRFYILTDGKKIIYIDDEETQEMLHYGDSAHIVDISEDFLDKEIKAPIIQQEKVLREGLNNG